MSKLADVHCIIRHFKIKHVLLLLITYSVSFSLWIFYPIYHETLPSPPSWSSLGFSTEYSYSPTKGIENIIKYKEYYKFHWKDWVDLSPLLSPSESSSDSGPTNLNSKNENNKNQQHDYIPPSCNYTKLFEHYSKRNNRRLPKELRKCSNLDYLASHTTNPSQIIFLSSDNWPSSNGKFQSSDFSNTKRSENTSENNNSTTIDFTSENSLIALSQTYSKLNHVDKQQQQYLKHFLNSQSVQQALRIILSPMKRYEIKPNLTDEQILSGYQSTQSRSLISLLFSKLIPSTKPFLPQFVSSEPERKLSNLYRPTHGEMIRRVQTSIYKENLLKPLHEEFSIESWQSGDNQNLISSTMKKLILPRESVESYINFQPTEWKSSQQLQQTNEKDQSNQPAMSLEESYHENFLETHTDGVKNSSKYFREHTMGSNGFHFDFRFYHHELTAPQRVIGIHHLFRAWSKFTQDENIISWLAHGTLLGWYWNGLSLPWDSDIDIQVPIAELDRLARKYNNTLIIENFNNNNNNKSQKSKTEQEDNLGSQNELDNKREGIYLLDITPSYISREKGNGENVIDARFIDTSTGLFIDITGIAHAQDPKTKSMRYGCKNNHFYELDDLFPLRLTLFEGAPTYIPNNYPKILGEEYKNWDNFVCRPHMFNHELGIWVEKFACRKQLRGFENLDVLFKNTSSRSEFLEKNILNINETSASELEYNNNPERYCERSEIRVIFEETNHLTYMHQQEMALLESFLLKNKTTIDTEKEPNKNNNNNKIYKHYVQGDDDINNNNKRNLTDLNDQELEQLAQFLTRQPPAYQFLSE